MPNSNGCPQDQPQNGMAPATLHINRYWLSMCELHEAWCDQQQWCDQPECESDELDHRKRAWRRGLFST
jgi:hypothetical protein